MTKNNHPGATALMQVVIYFTLVVLVHAFTGPRHGVLASLGLDQWTFQVADAVIYLVAILLTTAVICRLFNRSSLEALGLPRQRLGLVVSGLTLGTLLIILVFIVSVAMGWVSVTGFVWSQLSVSDVVTNLIGVTALQLAIATNEEVIFRGFILQRLTNSFGFITAALVSSLLFALVHVANPNASPWSALALFVPGLLLAAQYRLTHALWMSIGFHFGWNMTEGLVGFPLSGVSGFSLLNISIHGPAEFIGGEFGPEGALLGVLASVLGFVILYFWPQVMPSKVV